MKVNLRQQREQKGRLAETWASFFLFLKGYRLLKRRYKTPMGEIDLVFKRGNVIVLCEVKARSSKKEALESLSFTQKNRIINGARYFQSTHPLYADCDFRFDFVGVSGWRCHHLKNAWST